MIHSYGGYRIEGESYEDGTPKMHEKTCKKNFNNKTIDLMNKQLIVGKSPEIFPLSKKSFPLTYDP